MVNQQMINDKINDLFDAIYQSDEYKKYLEIGRLLENNKEIKELIDDIKKLQQKSVKLEYNNNLEYKVDKLNSIPIYREYLKRMNTFNNILSESSNNIEKYINDKIQEGYNGYNER